MRRFKTIKVEVDQKTWEEFFRLFPEKGERSSFLRTVIGLAITKGREDKDRFPRMITEEALDND